MKKQDILITLNQDCIRLWTKTDLEKFEQIMSYFGYVERKLSPSQDQLFSLMTYFL